MHIVMLSDAETSGGAAIAASRLALSFVRAGARVTRIVGNTDGQEHPWDTQVLGVRLRDEVVLQAFRKLFWPLAVSARKRLVCQRLHNFLMKDRPDVINVHNLHGAGWWPDLVSVCARHAATVWTLHDMWSFTGHCAYSYNCEKFISGCDNKCPTPMEYPALTPNLVAASWRDRKKLLSRHPDLVAVCPSHWLAREAKRGHWKGRRIEVIPNGVDLDIYEPLEKNLARKALGIETSAPVVLTVAQDLNERRKGGEIIVNTLRKTKTRPLAWITMGSGRLDFTVDGITSYPLGYVIHERTKMLVYNAADLLVHPALVDNFPNTVLEAIACGTPVVAFAVGGVPEMVRPGQTGWLADGVSPEALAATIDAALADLQFGTDLRESCRNVAEAEYNDGLQARRYLTLFRSLTPLKKSCFPEKS